MKGDTLSLKLRARVLKYLLHALGLTALILLALNLYVPQLLGLTVHEYVGSLFLIAVLLHVSFNGFIFKALFKNLSPYFLWRDSLTVCLLALYALMFISGILISQHVFDFIHVGGRGLWRDVHVAASIYALILTGAHLGLHLYALLSLMRESLGRPLTRTVLTFVHLLALNGLVVFVNDGYLDRLLQEASFGFFDYEKAWYLTFSDLACVFCLPLLLSYHLSRFLLYVNCPRN